MFRAVMVAAESIELDRAALSLAVRVAAQAAARLHVVHVQAGRRVSDLEHSVLLRAVEWSSAELGESVSFELIHAAPGNSVADQLVDYATEHEIDLLVLGTHGRGRIGRVLLGSVAEAVVRSIDLPVLLAPRKSARLELRHFFVPLDGTPAAETILEDAAELAALFGGSITLLQVIQATPAERHALDSAQWPLAHEEFVLRTARSEEYLDRTADRLRQRGLDVRTTTLVGEHVQSVVEHAAGHADVIVLTPYDIDPGWRLLKRGVADGLLERSDCALLLRHGPAVPAAVPQLS